MMEQQLSDFKLMRPKLTIIHQPSASSIVFLPIRLSFRHCSLSTLPWGSVFFPVQFRHQHRRASTLVCADSSNIISAAKIDHLVAEHRNESLDSLVSLMRINADQRAAYVGRPR
ncbi:hypothetical protein B0H65DRAFT_455902 [Neurospora tetraspora]|uniref:Uncharacterized protein n=1 Tax=Neurospora tetraspora TaxID=94610 RepID=A0AAE0JJX1_9PEZI|nr:hypothetical protein B0H65DRAFT_455902 [Neurospora tetraspora]